jgi:hypothetical protein
MTFEHAIFYSTGAYHTLKSCYYMPVLILYCRIFDHGLNDALVVTVFGRKLFPQNSLIVQLTAAVSPVGQL